MYYVEHFHPFNKAKLFANLPRMSLFREIGRGYSDYSFLLGSF